MFVFWPGDSDWYGGYIVSFHKPSMLHRVLYDDGEWEFVDLRAHHVSFSDTAPCFTPTGIALKERDSDTQAGRAVHGQLREAGRIEYHISDASATEDGLTPAADAVITSTDAMVSDRVCVVARPAAGLSDIAARPHATPVFFAPQAKHKRSSLMEASEGEALSTPLEQAAAQSSSLEDARHLVAQANQEADALAQNGSRTAKRAKR